MKSGLVLLLLFLNLGSAIAVVTVRHENRLAFIDWQEKQDIKNASLDEWGRLLLEWATWAGEHSIVEEAGDALGMIAPDASEIVTIHLGEEN